MRLRLLPYIVQISACLRISGSSAQLRRKKNQINAKPNFRYKCMDLLSEWI